MKVALGQFVISPQWQNNAETCQILMARSVQAGAALLVLPEACMAQDGSQADAVLRLAQPLDGPFVNRLLSASRGTTLTTVAGMHIPSGDGLVYNVLVVIRDGELVAHYHKLHLYDAWEMKESKNVKPGNEVPPLLDVAGFKVGLMTCYDLRFPDMARRLVMDGAEVLVAPSAWVKGPLKEKHWEMLTTTRALENTCYLIGVSACGGRNIGNSLVVDPMGMAIAHAAEEPALIFAELDRARLAQVRQILPVLENQRFVRPLLVDEWKV
ncbi:hydrolase [Chimaeribacter coloradensis]|uniref:Hydrolase n=1 Tax=Chimaeribacter coloradensis TaxID=2060068 RepID=A0A2N5EB73_9GAMM|nr:deaminated glutathione amidase [Chimaeribacter coloradensis]PLR39377.1 hydrolase [Chimaeribacter coloradensis]